MPRFTVDAILFDMDGTLVHSTPGVLKAWELLGAEYGFNGAQVAYESHGRRLYDTVREYCRIHDEEKLQREIARFEQAVIDGSPVALPGTRSLLRKIGAGSPESASGWTIVTSATPLYARQALSLCGVPIPPLGLITSDDVANGKPHPAPFLAGARRLGADPTRCLVVEDAPSGLFAGRAAGCKTVAVCTTHSRERILKSGAAPDYIIKDLTQMSARWVGESLEVTIKPYDA